MNRYRYSSTVELDAHIVTQYFTPIYLNAKIKKHDIKIQKLHLS